MSTAKRDQNGVPVFLGVLNTDGATPMMLYVNPATGAIKVNDASTGTYPGGTVAKRDENFVTTRLGIASNDGTSLMKVLINSSNELLIDSN